MVGRSEEISLLQQEVGKSRLVSIVGAGGVGKTTVALAVAERLIGAFSDGVWLVDFAPLRDASLVPHAIASAMGLAWRNYRAPMQYFATRHPTEGNDMDMQSMRTQMQGWLKVRGASSTVLESFEEHWSEAVRRAPATPEGPCPTCFQRGSLAVLELLDSDGVMSRAQCIDCGVRYLWKSRHAD